MKERFLWVCWLLVAFAATVVAQERRVYVLSDTHVMAPSLLKSEGTAWTEYLAGQRKLLDYSWQLFDDVVSTIKSDRPDMVLITGDLTKDGEVASHDYVKARLDELRDAGIKVFVIPGNHDRGSQSGAYEFDGATKTKVTTLTDAQFATYYKDYGYGSDVERDPNGTLSYVCEPFPGLVLIGIDSKTNGTLSEATLGWVLGKAAEARDKQFQIVAMMHHALVPHITNGDLFADTYVVNQKQTGTLSYDNLRKRFIEAGVRVILTGHFHTSDIAKDFDTDDQSGDPIYDISTGSTISYPCDYRILTFSSDLAKVDVETVSIKTLDGVDNFPTVSKNRLHESIYTLAYNKIDAMAKAKLGSGLKWTIYNSMGYSKSIATLVADAFIEHAEGDEGSNSAAAKTKSDLEGYYSLAQSAGVSGLNSYQDMTNSMLEDKAPYGTGRENVTTDRTLGIEFAYAPMLLTTARNGWASYCGDAAVDLSETGLTGYIVSGIGDESVTLKAVTAVPQGEGFIVNGDVSTLYALPKTAASTDDMSDNMLTGIAVPTAAAKHTFALSDYKGETAFYPVREGLVIPAHRAVLVVSDEDAAKLSLHFAEPSDDPSEDVSDPSDNTTGIRETSVCHGRAESPVVYNLAGQRVGRGYKGIVIVNGRKVVL